MIPGFGKLSDNQIQITKDAIAWITVLIAGADGEIDTKEKEWAAKVAHIRSYHNPNELTPFYEAVGVEFNDKLTQLLANVPSDTKERTAVLTRKLEQLNEVLPLLENNLGYHLAKSYRSFSSHIAKASGGILGFFSVSSQESKLVDLPMINEVEWIEEEVIDFEEE